MERWQTVFDVQHMRASGSLVLVPAPDVVVADGTEEQLAGDGEEEE